MQGGFCPPVSMAGTLRVKHQQNLVLSGTDFLGAVKATNNVSDSTVLDSWLINPIAMMPGSRLAQFGELWDKYKFLELEVIAETVGGTNSTGTMCMALDPDVLDDYTTLTGDTLIQRMSAAPANVSFPVWQPISLKTPGKFFNDPTRWVDPNTDSDPRTVYTGKLWVASVGGLNPGTYLRLYCRWKIQFENPALDTSYADGSAIIFTQNSAQISAQYPFGDYSTIIVNGTGYIGAPSVVFKSSTTLGSVIQFQSPGFYIVAIARTGTAMGIGAFTSIVFNGCTQTVTPSIPGIATPYGFVTSNGGSTQSCFISIVEATKAGATMSSTGDSGVTHTSAQTFVSKFSGSFSRSNTPMYVSNASLSAKVAELESHLKRLSLPGPASNIFPSSVFSTSSTETITSPVDPATGMAKTFTVSGSAEVDQTSDVITVAAGFENMKQQLEKEGYILIPPNRKE